MINYKTIKSLLFKFEPETAHHIAEFMLRIPNVWQLPFNSFLNSHFIQDDVLKQNIFQREFLNPIGLAAGFDKNATMIRGTNILGFGFTEIGTFTPKPQEGNPKPRMFRHIAQESIQNAMGFNNDGSYKILKRLQKRFPYATPIGINIGKNKTTTHQNVLNDYTHLIKTFNNLGDYFVINISSPNTPGLRDLQNEEFISTLFKSAKKLTTMPILLKISPDMDEENAVNLAKTAVECGADGIIATNTTVDYSLVDKPKDFGGISGRVLQEKSFQIFKAIAKELHGKTILISVGGVDSAQEAYRRIKAGASLVQVFSALVYKGPDMIRDMNQELIALLKKDGFQTITQAIGSDLH